MRIRELARYLCMAIFRYVFYFLGIALFTWLLTMLEITSPGSLKLHVITGPGDTLGTSEYSPIEIIQPGILGICGLLYAWVAKYCPSQRPKDNMRLPASSTPVGTNRPRSSKPPGQA